MVRTLVIGAFAGALVALGMAGAAPAQTASTATKVETTGQSAPRVRPRITVSPRAPYRNYSTTYPVQAPYDFPGPGFVRQCSSRLVAENRLSGAVLVPRMHCWWQPGRSDLLTWPD
jgi:hypothetical protein